MRKQVVIIGGGAAGMTAGIFAARAGASVTILEHMDRVGKKILSTGNGRCNFTNRHQEPECYRSDQADFPWQVIRKFPVEDTLEFFRELGIWPKERDGYVYPNSDQASSVLDVLRFELDRLGVRVMTNCHVREIRPSAGRAVPRFVIETDQGRLSGDVLILAAGSMAAPSTGSDGSGYRLAERLGHRVIAPLPALTQLRCREKDYRQLAGVRTEGRIRLYVSDAENASARWSLAAEDQGEIQLTDYGISGIPVFQVSRFASLAIHNKQRVKAVLDFLPRMTGREAEQMLRQRAEHALRASAENSGQPVTCERFMTGLLNRKLSLVLLKRAGINSQSGVEEIPETGWNLLFRQIKEFETYVTAPNSYEHAQVCLGGVDTAQVDPETMESRLVKGLYFAGEILDVDGICGGYNLQWAWSSGAVAGRAAGCMQRSE